MPQSLYLHVPFCPKICPYCDFHKMRRNETLVEAYIKQLEHEAKNLYQEFSADLDTIYWGGGTPSHLSDREITQIIAAFAQTWGWPARLETTLEADPLTFDKARLQTFREMGFSRLSLGLQSTQDEVLSFLGRRHNGKQALEALELALDAGFEVSADLITGLSMQDTAQDLHALAQTGLAHISVYTLTIEPYTPFALRDIRLDEDKEVADYELSQTLLQDYGLDRYEVSSHAKPGHESKHNQVYWHGDYFLNLGPGAAGFVPKSGFLGERRTNPPIKDWLAGELGERIEVNAEDYVLDVLMTGLRTRAGVDTQKLAQKSGIQIFEKYHSLISDLLHHELIEVKADILKLSSTGQLQLNGIVRKFFNA
ncbi:MAG: radical SAM family heme chaperone HemW [Trueperaceae bacterium]|nr:radical SAM family heme chaperone HemW [Trueperaceae bacterium]